jgi:tRNA-splicing endonuclease subunit Sen54
MPRVAGKRPASEADAADLFRRGGPKAIRVASVGDAAGAATADARLADDDDDSHLAPPPDPDASSALLDARDDGGALAAHPRLLARLRNLCAAWRAPAWISPNAVSVAAWRERPGVAEVLRRRGKHLAKLGYSCGPRLFLHPEETLFLVETQRLVLFASETGEGAARPMSVAATRRLCVGNDDWNDDGGNDDDDGKTKRPESENPRFEPHRSSRARRVSESRYRVFAHLLRRGLFARRFDAPFAVAAKTRGGAVDHERARGGGAWAPDEEYRRTGGMRAEDFAEEASEASEAEKAEEAEENASKASEAEENASKASEAEENASRASEAEKIFDASKKTKMTQSPAAASEEDARRAWWPSARAPGSAWGGAPGVASPSTSTRSNRLRTDFEPAPSPSAAATLADRPVYQVYRPSAGGAAAFSKKNPPDVAFVVFLSEDANSADENRRARSGRVLRRTSKDFGERTFEEDFGEDAAPDAARVAAATRAVKAAGGGLERAATVFARVVEDTVVMHAAESA